jgi:4-hydroxy-3-methylbut-2-enyl diphosphate reductase
LTFKIIRADKVGFCFGVKGAIDIVEKEARRRGGLETLGAVVHNQPVLDRLSEIGVTVARSLDEVRGDAAVTSSHGVTPEVEEAIRARNITIIDTTCSFVKRAQAAARRLEKSGFFVVIYGDADHVEVKGIIGWAQGKAIATMDDRMVTGLNPMPRRLGILAQTTKTPAQFIKFVQKIIDGAFVRDSELHVIDTICHDVRQRQTDAVGLAHKVDIMLVVGGHNSANTNQLAKLCSAVAETHLVETVDEIQPAWFNGVNRVGITAGASTDERSIDEVVAKLEAISDGQGK